ncbi:MAG: hypothetical protein ACRBM6_17495 [Geminicoccales bacterium]
MPTNNKKAWEELTLPHAGQRPDKAADQTNGGTASLLVTCLLVNHQGQDGSLS